MRLWLALAASGAVIAVGVPVVWQVTRPASTAGTPVAEAQSSATASAETSAPATADRAGVATQDSAPQAGSSAEQAPQRLTVRSLRIDASIDPVGVAANGAMALPTDVRRIGWYEYSPAPGSEQGSVVLAGHVDNARQGTGALFDLRSVAVGARITVVDADGGAHAYRVTGRQMFVKKRLPVERLFATDGPPRLVIITCGGPFNRQLHSYRDNLVVAAEPVL